MLYQISNGAVELGAELILKKVNFEIRDREKIAVVGRNGSGKTTLLKLISGEVDLLKRDSDEDVFIAKAGNPEIGYLKQMAFEDNTITVDQEIRKVFSKVHAMQARMDREPTLEEIAAELSLDIAEVSQALDAVCAPVSLHDPVYSDGGDPLTVMDQVRDTKNTELNWMEHITLQGAFCRLNQREKQILSLRFYDGRTQMEVANSLGISQAQVSRLEKGAISAMRKSVSVS